MGRPRDANSDELTREEMTSADTARSNTELRVREEVLDLGGLGPEFSRWASCGISNFGMLEVEAGRFEDATFWPEVCSEVPGITGLPGTLGPGVFDREIQTPSTSMPLSIARTPKGISRALRCLALSVCCISFRCASLVAAMAVYLRSLQRLYPSLPPPTAITPTWIR